MAQHKLSLVVVFVTVQHELFQVGSLVTVRYGLLLVASLITGQYEPFLIVLCKVTISDGFSTSCYWYYNLLLCDMIHFR